MAMIFQETEKKQKGDSSTVQPSFCVCLKERLFFISFLVALKGGISLTLSCRERERETEGEREGRGEGERERTRRSVNKIPIYPRDRR